MACRYGEEEFVMITPGASEAVTTAKAEQIRQMMKQRPGPGGATISLSLGAMRLSARLTYKEDC